MYGNRRHDSWKIIVGQLQGWMWFGPHIVVLTCDDFILMLTSHCDVDVWWPHCDANLSVVVTSLDLMWCWPHSLKLTFVDLTMLWYWPVNLTMWCLPLLTLPCDVDLSLKLTSLCGVDLSLKLTSVDLTMWCWPVNPTVWSWPLLTSQWCVA